MNRMAISIRLARMSDVERIRDLTSQLGYEVDAAMQQGFCPSFCALITDSWLLNLVARFRDGCMPSSQSSSRQSGSSRLEDWLLIKITGKRHREEVDGRCRRMGQGRRMFNCSTMVEFHANEFSRVLPGCGLHQHQDAILLHQIP